MENEDPAPRLPLDAVTRMARVGNRFNGKRLHLTYPGKQDKQKLYDFINGLYPIEKFSCCHEMYTDPGNEEAWHTHCAVWFKDRVNIVNMRRFDIAHEDDPLGYYHPNWRPVNTGVHWNNVVNYHKKEDADPMQIGCDSALTAAELRDRILGARNMVNVLQDDELCAEVYKKPKFVEIVLQNPPAEALPLPNHVLRPWQVSTMLVPAVPADSRSVYWVSGPTGCEGKSYLADMLERDHSAIVMQEGSKLDLAFIYNREPLVVFNYGMGTDQSKVPYTFMEDLKDGRVFSRKYIPITKRFVPPHVIVFANFLPDFDKLARDRWRIMDLGMLHTTFRTYQEYHTDQGNQAMAFLGQGQAEAPF